MLVALLIVLEAGFLKYKALDAVARLRAVPRRLRARFSGERPPCYDERWTLLVLSTAPTRIVFGALDQSCTLRPSHYIATLAP